MIKAFLNWIKSRQKQSHFLQAIAQSKWIEDSAAPDDKTEEAYNPIPLPNIVWREVKSDEEIAELAQRAIASEEAIGIDLAREGSDRTAFVRISNAVDIIVSHAGDRTNQSELLQLHHCESCSYYYGKTHEGNHLYCTVHPYKPENTLNCEDYAS